jgi:predicted DNA-binding transcriptional regulator AlpA
MEVASSAISAGAAFLLAPSAPETKECPVSSKKSVAEVSAAVSAAASDAPNKSPPRLIDKNELLRRIPFTFPTIWKWMQEKTPDGKPAFPRSRNTGGKCTWVESEVNDWILNRPLQVLKGDDEKSKAITS